jgi:hypothetical protein
VDSQRRPLKLAITSLLASNIGELATGGAFDSIFSVLDDNGGLGRGILHKGDSSSGTADL